MDLSNLEKDMLMSDYEDEDESQSVASRQQPQSMAGRKDSGRSMNDCES